MPTERPEYGTYVLVLRLSRSTEITVGKLGTFDFPKGFYLYVGSAHGPGGLAARLRHHLSHPKNPHWHIDCLRRAAEPVEVWTSGEWARREHSWALLLYQMQGAAMPAAGFGASDCRCPSHLFHFSRRPTVKSFAGLARTCYPGSGCIRSFPVKSRP